MEFTNASKSYMKYNPLVFLSFFFQNPVFVHHFGPPSWSIIWIHHLGSSSWASILGQNLSTLPTIIWDLPLYETQEYLNPTFNFTFDSYNLKPL